MLTRLLSILAALTVLAGCASMPTAPTSIVTEAFMICGIGSWVARFLSMAR